MKNKAAKRHSAGPEKPPSSTARPGATADEPAKKLAPPPFPDDLLEEAEQESNQLDLDKYWQVIAKLREKGFTYRQISDWLGERNIDADHSAVYRVYTKHLSPDQAEAEDREHTAERLLKEI